jgi:phosphohistidine phosphatase
MKTLYLLRHAHTFAAAPPLMGDHERILSPQGAEEALQVGKFMQAHEFYPDFVLSSSSVRTIQTARLIFGVLFSQVGIKVASHFDRRLFHASAETMLSEIRQIDRSIQHLLVVGHNPGIAELALQLGDIDHYAPATLAVFKADCREWSDFSPDTAKLEQVFVPEV